MDLIYTDSRRIDLGVLSAYKFDLSFGASENDFSVTVESSEAALEFGSLLYLEGTEYGGIVDAVKAKSNSAEITYTGRTWHGVLNSKVIQPDPGKDYYIVSGEANSVLAEVIARLGLTNLFQADKADSGVVVKRYQFHRYCNGYNGIRAMLAASGAKLKIAYENRSVKLSAEPIADYTEAPVDGDTATLSVEHHEKKVNHLICLGKGDLANREVIHLYVGEFGEISDIQYYTGLSEIAETYENSNSEDLRSDGIKKMAELQKIDKADIDISETEGLVYDIGDIVGATEYNSGVKVSETVTQKIVRINNGVVSVEYKTGGTSTTSGSGSTSSGGESSTVGNSSVLPTATKSTLGGIIVGSNLAITENGTLSVSTTSQMEQDNTLPITSAGVYATVGNIEALLKTI